MKKEEWRNADGSVNYQDYMSSEEWRRFREAYWKRHPKAQCSRCGMSQGEHRRYFGTRLHLNHITYRNIACEEDSDLEPLCKPCHTGEHSGDPDHKGDPAVEALMALIELKDEEEIARLRREIHPVAAAAICSIPLLEPGQIESYKKLMNAALDGKSYYELRELAQELHFLQPEMEHAP